MSFKKCIDAKFIAQFLSILILVLSFQTDRAFAFQTYFGEDGSPQVNPDVKDFDYYLSPTYWDLFSNREKPITEFLVQATKDSIAFLEHDMAHIGVRFHFAGFKDIDSLNNKNGGEEFDRKIYIDWASRDFQQVMGMFGGSARIVKVNPSDTYASGGRFHLNGKLLNFHHPRTQFYTLIVHELFHVLGVGHSTNPASLMAYTETWQPRFSFDDQVALSTIYRVSTGVAPKVTVTMDSVAASGIELHWIDTTTGKSQSVITNRSGEAKIYGLNPGTYYLVGRELTPTGPCFSNPTKGFLSTFYVSDTASSNELSQAKRLTLSEGAAPEFKLNLIKGTKKFECHNLASIWCKDSERCARTRISPGSEGRANFQNDLSTTHHQTQTDLNSGAHSSIVVSKIGDRSPFTIGTTILGDGVTPASIGYNLKDFSVADFAVGAGAEEGSYAGICQAAGQTSVMGSMIEIMNDARWVFNSDQWPEYLDQMTSSDSPLNWMEMTNKDAPSKPKKVIGLACGSVGVKYSKDLKGMFMIVLLFAPFAALIKRKYLIKGLMLMIGCLFIIPTSQAVDLYSGLWYESNAEKDGSTNWSTSEYRLALSPMFGIYSGLAVGGKFVYQQNTSKNPSSSASTTFAALGPSIGYNPQSTSGFTGSATYLLMPTRTTKTISENTLHGGSGISIDAGYRAAVGNIAIGPVLSYNQYSFKKETTESLEQSINLSQNEINGYFGIWYRY
ncbi:MAG: hypothetical protein NT027_12845 [Proteobacteria bacterium]|nr:hypothetical protein [Pseudomonadota bacterium]